MATVEVPGKTATAAPAILPTRLSIPRITLLSLYWVAIGYLWNSMGAQVLPPLVLRFVGHASQGTALSILESTGTFAAIFVQPVMGSLSDHTNFWWGRRRPYIAGGTIGSATFLVLMAFVGSYFWLFALYFLLQLSENTAQGPYQGLLPDVVPEADRGKASAFVGLGNLVGTLIGSQVIGLFARHNRYDLAVMSMAAVLLFTMALTVTLIPDRVKPAPGLRLNLSEVTIGTFKISPKKHANFMWLIACRLLILMGVVGLQTYVFFFFKDVFYAGPGQKLLGDASGATQYLLGIIVFMALLAAYPAARLSDRVGRKPLVIACGVLGGLGALGLVFSHYTFFPGFMTAPVSSILHVPVGLGQVLYYGILIGVATGSFLSVDWAFMVDVIPADEAGRFLGFSNIASAGAGIIARTVAGPVLDAFNRGHNILGIKGGYPAVFGMFFTFFVVGTFLVLPVREKRRQQGGASAAAIASGQG